MLIAIASLQQPTFHSEFSWPRKPGQSMTDYVSQELSRRMQFVSDRLDTAAQAAQELYPDRTCLFFTLPEFFWNLPWDSVRNEEELLEFGWACMDRMPECMELLMSWARVETHGKIILLAGSCATLIKVGEGQGAYFDVVNYLLSVNNFNFRNDGLPELSMWPKRHVSGIDFGEHASSEDGYWFFKLSEDLTIKVKTLSSVAAEQNAAGSFNSAFSNTLIPGVTFSVNLCLDYTVVQAGERDQELEAIGSKIDFLIACGMSFQEGPIYPQSVQFAARNDGMGEGSCEFARVEAGAITQVLPAVTIEDTLYLISVELD
ncbi:hypothetical protein [Pseudomonas violetae]|uniref:Uncharacterized protein n=1 Tax=Pseudomonas violetae TaxID=2915813 RepID=A0ABT0F747_9PSED|nr:hypothetical protein [Pseudomonas violetae]MCK1793664.1 hypothetical protein [Pseudomonas violetae]